MAYLIIIVDETLQEEKVTKPGKKDNKSVLMELRWERGWDEKDIFCGSNIIMESKERQYCTYETTN